MLATGGHKRKSSLKATMPETGHGRRMTLARRPLTAISVAVTLIAAMLYWVNPEKVVLPVVLVGVFLLLATLTRKDRDLFAVWSTAPMIFRVPAVFLIILAVFQVRTVTDDIWGVPVAAAFAVFLLGLSCAVARRVRH